MSLRWLMVIVLASQSASAETFSLRGHVNARGAYTTGHPSWIEGGFGHLDSGGLSAISRAQNATTNRAARGRWRGSSP